MLHAMEAGFSGCGHLVSRRHQRKTSLEEGGIIANQLVTTHCLCAGPETLSTPAFAFVMSGAALL